MKANFEVTDSLIDALKENVLNMLDFFTSARSDILSRVGSQYELLKKEEVKVGDEVECEKGKLIVLHIFDGFDQVMDINHEGIVTTQYTHELTKTGKHYPLVEMLKELEDD